MKIPARQYNPAPATTAKVINLPRSSATNAKTNDAGSAPTKDPRNDYFSSLNGSRWGRHFRSN